jgi:hypothetical protein
MVAWLLYPEMFDAFKKSGKYRLIKIVFIFAVMKHEIPP